MPSWHPADTLLAVEFVFPRPGTERPFAILRQVKLEVDGERVTVWRAVTSAEPRTLIGYHPDLRTLVMRVHRHAINAGIRPELDETRR